MHLTEGRQVASASWGQGSGTGVVTDGFEWPELVAVAESWQDSVWKSVRVQSSGLMGLCKSLATSMVSVGGIEICSV